MTDYEIVIGLEVHAQLMTKTKLFCSCSTRFGAQANANTCPVCLALPGALPVLNRQAVDYAIMAGLATNCEIQKKSIWARKNYFYPDLPKGYQISQYEFPICLNGYLDIEVDNAKKRIGITRIHMEEDAGKSIHDHGASDESHVDLNRACTPLVEIVSEPDLRSADEAVAYLKKLRSILVYLEVCDGNMEEGSFRCDANVSLRPRGQKEFGTRTELKNINSFKFVEKAIEYEVKRQASLLDSGEKVIQETRLFDTVSGKTKSMRGKEDAHDYRYFPDPDLLPLIIDQEWISEKRESLPELPEAKAKRFVEAYSIPAYDAEVLTVDKNIAHHYEKTVALLNDKTSAKNISNLYMSHLLKLEKDFPKTFTVINPEVLAEGLSLEAEKKLSHTMLKEILEIVAETGQSIQKIIKEKGFEQVSDPAEIEKIIEDIIANNPENVEAYRAGKDKLFGFFVGQCMKALKGKGNPQLINELLKEKLKA